MNMIATMPPSVSRSTNRVSDPALNISLMASISVVIRLTRRPTGVRSKKAIGSRSTWRNSARRKIGEAVLRDHHRQIELAIEGAEFAMPAARSRKAHPSQSCRGRANVGWHRRARPAESHRRAGQEDIDRQLDDVRLCEQGEDRVRAASAATDSQNRRLVGPDESPDPAQQPAVVTSPDR